LLLTAGRALLLVFMAPSRRGPTSAWAPIGRVEIDSTTRRHLATDRWRRRRWVMPTIAVIVVAVVAYVVVDHLTIPEVADRTHPASSRQYSARDVGVVMPDDEVPAAYRGASWYSEFRQDMAWALDEKVAWRPLQVQRVLDVQSRTVNVRGGVRRSWTPPSCDCRRVRIWLYGGSGAFGVGQRDDHTIASELARAALADGVTLDVENRGVPGELGWRAATRFSWDLTQHHAPDLAVFYDGGEEVRSALDLRARGLGDVRAPYESFISDLYDEITPARLDQLPNGVQFDGWPTMHDAPRSTGALAVERYERGREMSRGTASARHVAVRYFWQPSRFDVASAPSPRSPDERKEADAFRSATASLPEDVDRLDGAVAGVRSPIFYDATNHDERGARLIAQKMWEDLRRQVTAMSRSHGQ
jgi:hypothetical protein